MTPAEVSRRLVLEHGAITFLPDLLCRADLAAGRMVRLYPHDLPAYEWHLRLIFRHRKRPDPGVQALLNLLARQPLLSQVP